MHSSYCSMFVSIRGSFIRKSSINLVMNTGASRRGNDWKQLSYCPHTMKQRTKTQYFCGHNQEPKRNDQHHSRPQSGRKKRARSLINRISGKVAYMRPLKQQASLRAHDLVRKHELVDVGHRFGKVSVLATMPGNFYSRKLERTLNTDRLKFNGRFVQSNINWIGPAIVAFVRS